MRCSTVALSGLFVLGLMLISCDSEWWSPDCGNSGTLDIATHFVGSDDYVGHELSLRVTGSPDWNPPDPAPYEEVYRTTIVIPTGDFSLHETGSARTCLSLHVDFFVDVNDNGSYDVPPTDHAWRLYSHIWEEEDMVKEQTFTFTLDPNSCTYDDGGILSICAYRDVEWPVM